MGKVIAMHAEEHNYRDETVKEILATTLELAKELQRELGRLQHIVDSTLPPKDDP